MASRMGLRGMNREVDRKALLAAKGQELEELQLTHVSEQMQIFKANLETFARKYKDDIQKMPELRRDFNKMCGQIGVDPLASKKGFWSELLGVSDFYYELSVQVVDVCISTRNRNGGIIEFSDLHRRLQILRGKKSQQISEDDIERAIDKLKELGNGFDIITIGRRKLVRSVPTELNADLQTILSFTEQNGCVSVSALQKHASWDVERVRMGLEQCVKEGLAWIDLQAEEPLFWFPSLLERAALSSSSSI
eukprot:m.836594 g.836594  ORF g.836594 m.836594 type:complete len:250 (-) comp59487_c0_seq7:2361-3110(-)